MTRIPWAIWTPATYDPAFPNGKYGYGSVKTRPLEEIRYVVNHDARGYRAYLQQGQRPGEEASWALTNCNNGDLLQHLELEQIAWISGNFQANFKGLGVEHENEAGPWGVPQPNPYNPAQVATDRHLHSWLLANGAVQLGPPSLGAGFEEHRRVAPGTTTCPNGRTSTLYLSYQGQPPITPPPAQEDYMEIINHSGNLYIPGPYGLVQVTPEYWNALSGGEVPLRQTTVDDAEFAALQVATRKQMELFPGGSAGPHHHTAQTTVT